MVFTNVEKAFVGKNVPKFPTNIPFIAVDNFPLLGKLAALRFIEWVADCIRAADAVNLFTLSDLPDRENGYFNSFKFFSAILHFKRFRYFMEKT